MIFWWKPKSPGVSTDPGEENVKGGTAYKINGVNKLGTLIFVTNIISEVSLEGQSLDGVLEAETLELVLSGDSSEGFLVGPSTDGILSGEKTSEILEVEC